jgi:hypothetical protein
LKTIGFLVVKAVVAALKRAPILNSTLDEATNELVYKGNLDIGIAGPGPLPGGVSRLTDRLLDSDVPWRPQVVDFALVTDDDFRRRAYEEREPWRPAN